VVTYFNTVSSAMAPAVRLILSSRLGFDETIVFNKVRNVVTFGQFSSGGGLSTIPTDPW